MENKEKDRTIRFDLKEIITMVTLLVSILFGYFGIIKDIETRLVRIETQLETLEKMKYRNKMMDPVIDNFDQEENK